MTSSAHRIGDRALPGSSPWPRAVLFAGPIVAFVVYLFYTWFAVNDRYLIFLYYHDMGPGFDTTPFGWVTASRYWMSGLVAAGAVAVGYSTVNVVLGRLFQGYRSPEWWRLWALCAVPLAIAVPALVMTVNDPVLPLANALQVTLVALSGLALALMPGRWAAERPLDLAWLLVDGLALATLLLILPGIGRLSTWLARGSAVYVYRLVFVLAGGLGLLALVTILRWWRRTEIPRAGSWFASGLIVAYLLFPLYHHLFWSNDNLSWNDPGYFVYISDADNYFSRNWLLQTAIWAFVALLALGLTRLRQRLQRPAPLPDTAGQQ